MTFIQAKNYTPSHGRTVSLIVLHSTESPESPGRASQIAKWFAGPTAPKASAHYVVDVGEIWQCVSEHDIAWAAPGANHNGIHIELVGYARQLPEDWTDVYSGAMLERAAKLTAEICKRYGLPAKVVGVADLLAGASGITRHMDVTRAFKKSTHLDPGEGFPLQRFVQRVGEMLSFPPVET